MYFRNLSTLSFAADFPAVAIISRIGSAAKVVSSIFPFTSLIHLMFYNLPMNSSDLLGGFYVIFPLVAVFLFEFI